MKILRQEDGDYGSFYIEENGLKKGLMTYKKSGANEITIDHTEVDQNVREKGLGRQMVAAAVEYARENDMKIVPTCPFVERIIDKTSEFQDVLAV